MPRHPHWALEKVGAEVWVGPSMLPRDGELCAAEASPLDAGVPRVGVGSRVRRTKGSGKACQRGDRQSFKAHYGGLTEVRGDEGPGLCSEAVWVGGGGGR